MANDIVKKQWTAFRKIAIPASAPPVQVSEMRNAFYAGAQMIFNEMIKVSSEESEKAADYKLDKIQKEFTEYAEKLIKKQSH